MENRKHWIGTSKFLYYWLLTLAALVYWAITNNHYLEQLTEGGSVVVQEFSLTIFASVLTVIVLQVWVVLAYYIKTLKVGLTFSALKVT